MSEYRYETIVQYVEAIPVTEVTSKFRSNLDQLPSWIQEAFDNGTLSINEKDEIYIRFIMGGRCANHQDMIVYYGGTPTKESDQATKDWYRSNIGAHRIKDFSKIYKKCS